MAYELITAPVVEPITLAEARSHLKDPPTGEDWLIQAYILAARERAEAITNRRFITQTWDWHLDAFPCWGLELPFGKLQSITSVKYYDTAGVQQTLGSSLYLVDAKSDPGRLTPAYGETWPSTREQMNAVTIRFVCGYGLTDKVPWQIRAAMLLMISHWYVNREPVNIGNIVTPVPMTVDDLLSPYRIVWF